MPTYQYACTVCDHAFDAVQSFSDDALTECPECQGRLRKLFSSVGVVFKGSGFYRTDSRSTSGSSSSTPSSDTSGSGSSASSTTAGGSSDGTATTSGSSSSTGSSSPAASSTTTS